MTKKYLSLKVIHLLLALLLICVVSSVYAQETGMVRAGDIEFLNEDGTNAFTFNKNDELTVQCDIANNSLQKDINLYVVVYEKEGEALKLVDIASNKSENFDANENGVLSDAVVVPEYVDENYSIKAFVMSDELEPYAYSHIEKFTEQAEEYFTQTPSVYRYYAPGVIRPDEGTIELTICPDRPYTEFGNGYDMPFKISSAVNEGNATANIFAVCIPQLTETRTEPTLQIVMKNRSGATYIEKKFSEISAFGVNKTINLAITWKANGNMVLYSIDQNGSKTQLASVSLGYPLEDDTLPYVFYVDKEGPLHVSEIKISSKQLSQWYLSKPGGFNSNSADTTLVTTNNLEETTVKKSNWHSSSKYHIARPAFRAEKQIYNTGEDVVFPIMSVNHSDSEQIYDVDIDISNLDGDLVYQKETIIAIENDSKYHIREIPLQSIKKPGLYEIHTRITNADNTYSEYDSSICVIPDYSFISDGVLSKYYGHHVNYDEDITVFEKTNVANTRMWFNEFVWNNLEPKKDSWQWQRMDDYVDMCEEADLEILGVLGYPSRWASKEPTQAEQEANARYEYRPNRWKPNSYDEWENYVYTVVDRYKGRIKYWEVYNEVNFHPPYVPAAFSGSTAEYAELLRIAYAAAKRADPDCTILISGFSPPSSAVDSNMPFEFAKEEYKSGYYDVFNVHGYSGANAVDEWLSAYKTSNPEIKAFMTEEFPYQKTTVGERAYATVKNPIDFLKAGYDKFYHFGMFGQENVFITAATLSPTQAYLSSAVLQANLRKCDSYDGSYTEFKNSALLGINTKFTRTDGKILSVFGTAKNTIEISVKGNITSCCDMYGREIDIIKDGDTATIQAEEIVYIVSDGSIQITDVDIISSGPIIKNGGFEELDGDVAAVGLNNCTPTNWTYRKFNSGAISLSSSGKYEGKYGLWFRTTSEGDKAYVFQNIDFEIGGTYEFRVRMRKNKDAGELKPYMFFFDRDNNKTYNTYFTLESNSFEYETARFTVVGPTEQSAAVGVGIFSGYGEIYIDDISVVRISD